MDGIGGGDGGTLLLITSGVLSGFKSVASLAIGC